MASVDTRKLKDSVAEFFKKGKFEKAAGALEELVKAEPREIAHRLKLGDAWRKAGERERAISAYQAAAKAYSDEGQLIKGIAAVKVILEIDPENGMAQRELAEMNQRRFAKPGQFLQKAAAPKALGARAVSELELAEGESATDSIAEQLQGIGFKNDAEALELDETPSRPQRPGSSGKPEVPRSSGVRELDIADLSGEAAAPKEPQRPPGRRGAPLQENLTQPPEPEAIELEPEPEQKPKQAKAAPPDAPAEPIELELVEVEPVEAELVEGEPLEIAAEAAPPTRRPITKPQPIADLIAPAPDEAEEVELLSISTDEEATGPIVPAAAVAAVAHPPVTATPEDLDAAFGAIVDEHDKKPARKVPPRIPLFSDLSQDAFVELVNALDYRPFQPGELILKEGDAGRSFFVIAEGKVRVFKSGPDGAEVPLAELEEGAFFGEMAMLSGAPRAASIAAVTETQLLEVTDKVLRKLVEKHPAVVNVLKTFYRQRLLNNVMAISPLFKDFDLGEKKALMAKFKMRQAPAGEVLIEQDKKSDGLYVVLHGVVNVNKKAGSNTVELAKLKEGDIFGEMSLLTHEPATATVAAAVPSIVLKLPRDQFQEMILTHPQILELVSTLTDQRRSATEAVLRGLGPGQDGMAFV